MTTRQDHHRGRDGPGRRSRSAPRPASTWAWRARTSRSPRPSPLVSPCACSMRPAPKPRPRSRIMTLTSGMRSCRASARVSPTGTGSAGPGTRPGARGATRPSSCSTPTPRRSAERSPSGRRCSARTPSTPPSRPPWARRRTCPGAWSQTRSSPAGHGSRTGRDSNASRTATAGPVTGQALRHTASRRGSVWSARRSAGRPIARRGGKATAARCLPLCHMSGSAVIRPEATWRSSAVAVAGGGTPSARSRDACAGSSQPPGARHRR